MAPIPASYHYAYSLAIAQWQTMQLGSHPTDLELASLRHFVSVHFFAQYPGMPRTQAAAAIDYGVTSAERDLISTDQGGVVGVVGGTIDAIVGTAESELGAVESGVTGALRAVERAVAGVLQQILRAVPLPRSALPAKVPTQLTDAYAGLAREAGTLTPTKLAASARTRTAIRRLGR